MLQRGMLPAVDTRQLARLIQRVMRTSPPHAMLVGQEAVVKDRIEPAPQTGPATPQVPMGECAFQGILNEVVGSLPVAVQQCTGEPPQAGDVRFAQSCSVRHSLTVCKTG